MLIKEVSRACRVTATLAFFFVVLASPSCAQQAGVLLGYGAPSDHGVPGYKTAWITFSPIEVHVAVTVPDVIVPRSSGFWRVGTYIACEYLDESQQDSAREVVWQTPIEKAPVIEQLAPCKSHEPGDVDNSEQDAGGSPESDKPTDSATSTKAADGAQAAKAEVPLCQDKTGQISFVSPTHVSEAFDDMDTCDPRGGRDWSHDDVRSLDAGKFLSPKEVFAERAAQAYAAAAKRGFAENSKEFNCPEPDADQYDLTSWSIGHVKGSWVAIANLNEFMGECAFPGQIDVPLPKSITGETSKPGLWKSFAAAVPHLSDFFLSPLGDYALIVVEPKNGEYHLYGYSVKNGLPAASLGEIGSLVGGTNVIVMAQWCSAKYVPQWSAVLQKIADHPLAAPAPRAK